MVIKLVARPAGRQTPAGAINNLKQTIIRQDKGISFALFFGDNETVYPYIPLQNGEQYGKADGGVEPVNGMLWFICLRQAGATFDLITTLLPVLSCDILKIIHLLQN